MRCNWSTTTYNLLRRFSHPAHVPLRAWHSRPAFDSQPFALSRNSAFATNGRLFFTSSAAAPSAQVSPTKSTVTHTAATNLSLVNPALTTAQISRSACQAVRLSLENSALGDAYYIVNSLRYSAFRGATNAPEHLVGLRQSLQKFESVAIDFGREVSPRLSSHALLHGLIRIGLTKKAYKLSGLMMKSGIRLRSKTLEAVMLSLIPNTTAAKGTSGGLIRTLKTRLDRPDVLRLEPSMLEEEGTRYAVRLLHLARKSRHRGTEGMYNTLISACIFNGEIIVASLIFGLVIRDWQHRRSLTVPINATMQSEIDGQPAGVKSRRDHLWSEAVPPSMRWMCSVLSSINVTMSQDGEDETFRLTFRAALQALANLATLLDERRLPFSDITPLIHTLYSCPRVEDEVWIYEGIRPKRVKAYPYFHGVLYRLIGSLPAHWPPRITMNPEIASIPPPFNSERYDDMLPPLNIRSYNTLLHYALRHRFSLGAAHKILKHMSQERHTPLEPDIVTLNILIRSGTLLRRPDITKQALQALRRRNENVDHCITTSTWEDDKYILPLSAMSDASPSRFSKALHRLNNEALVVPTHPPSSHPRAQHVPLVADSSTLSAYVVHLTSTGQPHAVADLLFRALPELAIVDTPSWSILTSDEQKKMRIKAHQSCLKRAVAYGPYFFASVLNALCKAGKTGLTERVWLLAKEAERASWITDFVPGIRPWCLSVHAYTTMIQCYGQEARKASLMRRTAGHIHKTDSYHWVPRPNPYVVGWANFALERDRIMESDHGRRSEGLRLGALLYRSMRSGARAVYEAFKEVQKQKKSQWKPHRIPKPDARLFNAALDLFSRQPGTQPRRARFGQAHWNRHLRSTSTHYARSGIVHRCWNPLLQEVAEDMVEAGYSVPPGLRHLFVGRWLQGTLQYNHPQQLERCVFAFPRVRKHFSPFSIPTHKNRGLPLGRRQPQRLGRRRSCKPITTMY